MKLTGKTMMITMSKTMNKYPTTSMTRTTTSVVEFYEFEFCTWGHCNLGSTRCDRDVSTARVVRGGFLYPSKIHGPFAPSSRNWEKHTIGVGIALLLFLYHLRLQTKCTAQFPRVEVVIANAIKAAAAWLAWIHLYSCISIKKVYHIHQNDGLAQVCDCLWKVQHAV